MRRRVAAFAAVSPSFLVASVALAQTAPSPATPDDPAQQVVVTSARTPQSLPDTLPSTTLITRADIDASPATDLPDLLRTMTSFNVAQTGPLGSQTSVFLRGADSRQVLVLVDGAPLARADFGSAPWELVPLAQIDHVEIVRGNLSSLYGAQAVGGVVQIFTKQGPGSSVALAGGDRGQVQASGSIGLRYGDAATPLDLRASLSGQTTDGYSARDARVDPSANPDADSAYQGAGSVSIGKTWAPGQRTDFTFMHSTTHSEYDGYTGATGQDTLTTELDAFSLHSRHQVGAALTLNLNAGETLDHYRDPTGFTPDGSGRTRLLGVGVDYALNADHVLQLGLEDRDDRYNDTFTPKTSRETKSVRAGWVGNFASVVDVQANLRHDDADDYGKANTGLFALGWRITPAWKVVGQYSTAFSAPSFSDEQYKVPGTTLAPERSRDLEFGVHWQGSGWLARATWFQQRQRNLVAFTPEFQTVNIGHASNRGVELSADGTLGPGKLGLDTTFQRARDEDTDTALLRRARTVATVNYRLPIFGWETGLWVRYQGQRDDVDPVTFATVTAAARTTLGLSTQHALTPNWTIGMKIDNLTNTRTPEVLGYTAPYRDVLFTLRGQW